MTGPVPSDSRWKQCPRCGKWFPTFAKYVDHAWKEKP